MMDAGCFAFHFGFGGKSDSRVGSVVVGHGLRYLFEEKNGELSLCGSSAVKKGDRGETLIHLAQPLINVASVA
jgi:hypothetical protein